MWRLTLLGSVSRPKAAERAGASEGRQLTEAEGTRSSHFWVWTAHCRGMDRAVKLSLSGFPSGPSAILFFAAPSSVRHSSAGFSSKSLTMLEIRNYGLRTKVRFMESFEHTLAHARFRVVRLKSGVISPLSSTGSPRIVCMFPFTPAMNWPISVCLWSCALTESSHVQ